MVFDSLLGFRWRVKLCQTLFSGDIGAILTLFSSHCTANMFQGSMPLWNHGGSVHQDSQRTAVSRSRSGQVRTCHQRLECFRIHVLAHKHKPIDPCLFVVGLARQREDLLRQREPESLARSEKPVVSGDPSIFTHPDPLELFGARHEGVHDLFRYPGELLDRERLVGLTACEKSAHA